MVRAYYVVLFLSLVSFSNAWAGDGVNPETGRLDLTGIDVQATDCSSEVAEGRICWDTDNDALYVGNGTTVTEIAGGSAGNSFETLDVPAGTDPVADAATDTLTITETSFLTLTGDSSTDTIAITQVTTDLGTDGLIAANAVALGTDTTNNYVATIADAGNTTITVANSGTETAAVTLDVIDVNCTNCLTTTEVASADLATLASTITVVDGTDATSFPAIFDSATGDLAIKTDAGLTYAADTGTLSATVLTEGANAVFNSGETPGGELGGTWGTPTIDDGVGVSSWNLTTPNILSKYDLNDTAVDDDDCTGEQGKGWYDSTDGAWEFCNANSGAPATLAAAAGDITDVGSGSTGAVFSDGDSDTLTFEGTTADDFEGTLGGYGEPTEDVTTGITLPADRNVRFQGVEDNGTLTAAIFGFSDLVIDPGTTAATQVDITADWLVLRDSNDVVFIAKSVSETATITTSGISGLEASDTEGSSTWYEIHIYAKEDGTVNALLNQAGTAIGTVPTDYVYSALVGYVRNDGSSNFVPAYQNNEQVVFDTRQAALTSGGSATFVDVDMTAIVPPAARRVFGQCGCNDTDSTANCILQINGGTGSSQQTTCRADASGEQNRNYFSFPVDSLQIFEYAVDGNTNDDFDIDIMGYWLAL